MKKLFLFGLAVISIGLVPTALGQRNMAREAAIEQQLQAKHPELVESFRAARVAMDRNDYVETERLLTDVVKQAADFDPALRRLGAAKIQNGQRAEGMKLLEQAIARNASVANLSSLAYALAFPDKNTASAEDKRTALNLLRKCRQLPDGQDEDVLSATAQLAFNTENVPVAREAVDILQLKYPDHPTTHLFTAYLTATDENWITAENEMRVAEKLGLDHQVAQNFYDSGIHSRALTWRWIYGIGWTVAAWVAGLALLCGTGYLLSNVTLRQIERSNPQVPIATAEKRLRKIYRLVLNITGLYYYISLPVVAVLVLFVSGAIIYGFLAIGRIPIQITLMLIVGVFATIWSMGKSLFLRVKASDPGRALVRAEAEDLWRLSEEVARDLETRAIDEIRITVGTDLCVYERGSWREKLNGQAKRILVVGTAVLNEFKIADFRSVLAHEYGHFSNRDTAGGDIALRVQNDMIKFYVAMAEAGQATWINVAFHFLRFYNFIFRRISHGATRLQEVLADRVAALHYGPKAFESGLRHVIRQHVNFDFVAEREINAAVEARRPLNNLYTEAIPQNGFVHDEFEKAIKRPTTPDDTHPGPLDRFRLIATLPEPAHPAPSGLVWDLFRDREAITKEMLVQVEKNIARHRS